MLEDRGERQRRLFNRLTVAKLALQLLERRTELSPAQRELVATALAACNELAIEVAEALPAAPLNWRGGLTRLEPAEGRGAPMTVGSGRGRTT